VRNKNPDLLKHFHKVMTEEAVRCETNTADYVGLPDEERDYCAGKPQVAHIIPRSRMGPDTINNLAWLCHRHHTNFDAGQSHEKVKSMQEHIEKTRHPAITALLENMS
jgi:hypothetical protein